MTGGIPMKIRKALALLISVMMVFTVICGCFVVTANATSTITYSYVVTASQAANAYEGKITYPANSLSVQSVTIAEGGQYNAKNGKILFNNSNASTPFDFSNGTNVVTVEFEVIGEYNPSDVYGTLTDFYSNALITAGNFPFNYTNVIDGEVVSRGHTDIDTPSNSYADTNYTVIYSYCENPESQTNATYTKSVWSHSSDASEIAALGMPRIENPYYGSYSVDSATLNAETATVNATLNCETKKYSVYLDGTEQPGKYAYLESATVNASEEKDFLINGVRVARGESYTFFVTGDTDITTEDPTGTIGESASLVSNALYISDNAQGKAIVKMELLASATSSDFSRMGVAFAKTTRSTDDIETAVNAITSGTDKTNGIAVHNSLVDNSNVSGQYQFIYAPYVSVSKVDANTSLYFYSYVVNNNGTVTVSAPQTVNFANVLA